MNEAKCNWIANQPLKPHPSWSQVLESLPHWEPSPCNKPSAHARWSVCTFLQTHLHRRGCCFQTESGFGFQHGWHKKKYVLTYFKFRMQWIAKFAGDVQITCNYVICMVWSHHIWSVKCTYCYLNAFEPPRPLKTETAGSLSNARHGTAKLIHRV